VSEWLDTVRILLTSVPMRIGLPSSHEEMHPQDAGSPQAQAWKGISSFFLDLVYPWVNKRSSETVPVPYFRWWRCRSLLNGASKSDKKGMNFAKERCNAPYNGTYACYGGYNQQTWQRL
jgi:hypothetical protein